MAEIDPSVLTARENYKILSGSVIPRPIAFVTTLSERGVVNAAPFSFFNVVTEDPPMVSISVERRDGKMKDTSRNAIEKKAFVVHITDESYIEQINAAAKPLPPDQSEVSYAGLTLADSTKIDVPGIREAAIRLECVLEKAVPLGGTDRTPACDLLIGRVVFYHIKDILYQNGHIDPFKLKPVGRLAGSAYTKLGDVFEIKRPL